MRNVEVRVKLAPSIAEALARIGERRGLLLPRWRLLRSVNGSSVRSKPHSCNGCQFSMLASGSLTVSRMSGWKRSFPVCSRLMCSGEIAATAATEA